MNNKFKNQIIAGLPYAALFASSFVCCFLIPEFNILSRPAPYGKESGFSPFLPGEILACFPRFIKTFNSFAASVIAAGLFTLTAFFISASIKRFSLKGEKSTPFFLSVIMIWISADNTLPVTYLAALPLQALLFFILSFNKSVRFLPALIFPVLYFAGGGFSIILAGMLIFRILSDRQPDRALLLLVVLSVVVTALLSRYFSHAPLLYPMELPDESFKRMLFILLTGLMVLFPAFSAIDLHITSFMSIKYATASILVSAIVILAVTLVALHESGFLFLK